MALTPFQRSICRLIASVRIESGESYVAGGAAMNEIMGAPRMSRDIDLFHDTEQALASSWDMDRERLEFTGHRVRRLRERPSFVEAAVEKDGESVLLQWVQDSAFRFFPLVLHDEFGLTLHPFDLATNKVLALTGRLEVRDWVDVIESHQKIQPLGYLVWGACGKDPGFSPASLLEEARRSGRYSAVEVAELSFEGASPDAGELSRQWRLMLSDATNIIASLPAEQAGKCVLGPDSRLYRGTGEDLTKTGGIEGLWFHPGSIRGVLPQVRSS